MAVVSRLTLRAAWWLHYYCAGDEAAAREVSRTGVSLDEAERLILTGSGEHRPMGIITADASTSA
jgi:hypothetical protein